MSFLSWLARDFWAFPPFRGFICAAAGLVASLFIGLMAAWLFGLHQQIVVFAVFGATLAAYGGGMDWAKRDNRTAQQD